jgi:predicted N-acetyltransferase YhbS
MKIYEEAMDQCLLCIDYLFEEDAPISREVAENKHQPGVRQKKWWNYRHQYLGLETLTAYIGPRPVGQIEFIPIEHAPRPIDGKDCHVITCLHVAHDFWDQGIGSSLLEAAENMIRLKSSGATLIASTSGEFMPAEFYSRHGYTSTEHRNGELLLYKPFGKISPPRMIPIKPINASDEGVRMDYFHCAQCPRSGWVLNSLEKSLGKTDLPEFSLFVTNIEDRSGVLSHGNAHRVFVNGRAVDEYPYPPDFRRYTDALRELNELELA